MAVSPPSIEAVLGDITAQQVDAVVNAANSVPGRGRGVDGAIHRAAGAADLHAACAALGGCDPGDAKVTPGFAPGGAVDHSHRRPRLGRRPVGRARDPGLLLPALAGLADELGARSIAFPAISTGVYGYPPDLAAEVAVSTVSSARVDLALVRLVAFDEGTRALYAWLISAG